ncbi:MAG: hypothetical protein Q9M40_07200 [Sulfurimonas sp.]|nr:hypothetical protein [Sulfurimonas sp.]
MNKTILIITLASIITLNSHAIDDFNCARPMTTVKPTSNYKIKQYNQNSSNYKACIDDYIRVHKQERDKHNNAVQRAIREWNSYVRGDKPNDKDTSQKFHGATAPAKGGSVVGYSDPTQIFTDFSF